MNSTIQELEEKCRKLSEELEATQAKLKQARMEPNLIPLNEAYELLERRIGPTSCCGDRINTCCSERARRFRDAAGVVRVVLEDIVPDLLRRIRTGNTYFSEMDAKLWLRKLKVLQ